jgi:hypothetical protein
MDVSDVVRQVVAHELSAFLRQFRIDHEAGRAADRAFYASHFSNVHIRIDRLELAAQMRTTRHGSATTSFSSSTRTFSSQDLGSPSLTAAQVESPAPGREGYLEFFVNPDDDGGIMNFEDFTINAEQSPPSSEMAGISLSSHQHSQHASATVLTASAAPTAHGQDTSAILAADTGEASFSAHNWAAGELLSAPPDGQPTWAPIPTPSEHPVSNVLMAPPSGLPPWAPLPSSYGHGVSSSVVHAAHLDAAISASPGQKDHNPRVCALCRYPFRQTKYRIVYR